MCTCSSPEKSQNNMPQAISNLNTCTRKHCYAQLDNMVFRENNWYTKNPIDAKTYLIWIRWFCHPHTTITIKDSDDIFIQSYLVLKPPCSDLVTVPTCDFFQTRVLLVTSNPLIKCCIVSICTGLKHTSLPIVVESLMFFIKSLRLSKRYMYV